MLTHYFLAVRVLRRILKLIGYLRVYNFMLRFSARGFFFCYVVLLPIALFDDEWASLQDFCVSFVAGFGFQGPTIFLSIVLSLVNVMIFVTAVDCLIAGVRARNQFLLGSFFSSESHDRRMKEIFGILDAELESKM